MRLQCALSFLRKKAKFYEKQGFPVSWGGLRVREIPPDLWNQRDSARELGEDFPRVCPGACCFEGPDKASVWDLGGTEKGKLKSGRLWSNRQDSEGYPERDGTLLADFKQGSGMN